MDSAEEIVFGERKSKGNNGLLIVTHKEPSSSQKTLLNFVKSPMNFSSSRKKSITEDFETKVQSFNEEPVKKIQGCERLFEDFFVIGLDKTVLKPGLQQVVSPKIVHSQGFSNEGDLEWYFCLFLTIISSFKVRGKEFFRILPFLLA